VNKKLSIAIDGPAGAGKTTQAKALAKALGYVYVDTGAMYRALAVYMQDEELKDVPEILPEVNLQSTWDEKGNQRMSINGVDVTDRLRTPEISRLASDISAIPEVRDFLLETQREIARENNVVMEGRDIGTVILPDATLKVFLTASLDERAWRRSRQLEPGTYLLPSVKKDIERRDRNDSSRDAAPLAQAEDAILVDCTHMNIKETTQAVLRLWDEALARKAD
jgi:cytidylate kinase